MNEPIAPVDVAVVGAGAAGLMAAVAAATAGARTLVVAQGPGATALSTADLTLCGDHMISHGYEGATESPDALATIIQQAAFGLARDDRIARYCNDAATRLADILSWGLRRPVQIGPRSLLTPARELQAILRKRAADLGVAFLASTACGLRQIDHRVVGISIADKSNGLQFLQAGATVVASGGCHGLLDFNTGGNELQQNAHAWALRAGAQLADLEFVGYCPLVLAEGNDRGSIVPYQLSQLGSCTLLDVCANNLLPTFPRDAFDSEWDKLIVGYKMIASARAGKAYSNGTFAFCVLDPVRVGQLLIPILSFLEVPDDRKHVVDRVVTGTDLRVGLAAHYSCGGIVADCDGQSGVAGLYACGEAAAGTFGAHRVASSITDCLVFGWAAGCAAAKYSRLVDHSRAMIDSEPIDEVNVKLRRAIISLVTRALALPRRGDEISNALAELRGLKKQQAAFKPESCTDRDTLLLAEAIMASALARRDSRGFHLRVENETVDPTFHGNITTSFLDGELVVALVGKPARDMSPVNHIDYARAASQLV